MFAAFFAGSKNETVKLKKKRDQLKEKLFNRNNTINNLENQLNQAKLTIAQNGKFL